MGNNITLLKSIKAHFNPVKCFLAATSLACLFSAQGCHVCRMIFLSGVISHPATPEDETSGNPQQLVWFHGETAVLVVSCKGVGFLSVAACCTWRNNQEPQRSPSLQIANGWKEQRHKQGTKKQRNLCSTRAAKTWSNPQKKTSLCVCVSLLLNFNLKNADTPPEFIKTWHLGTEHFGTNQRVPTNRHWVSAVTTTISPCCKASIWGSSSCRAHQLLAKIKEVISGYQTNSWSSNTSTTSRIQNS